MVEVFITVNPLTWLFFLKVWNHLKGLMILPATAVLILISMNFAALKLLLPFRHQDRVSLWQVLLEGQKTSLRALRKQPALWLLLTHC